jgi:hypothetical protein
MKIWVLFIAFFLTAHAVGQPMQKVKQLLKEKRFIPFNKYVENPPKSNVAISWEILRTIVGDYQEGVVKIEENVPSNDGTGGNFINNYRIYLLSTNDEIFYYKFIETQYKSKGGDQWEQTEKVIDTVKQNNLYISFEELFRQTYGDILNQKDLFFTSIVYGDHCGFAGVDSEYMEQLNLLLQRNKINVIRQWLGSANAEKQLYALRGYRVLTNQGYSISDTENKLIAIVTKKRGGVSTCSGCNYMKRPFQDVVSEIYSMPIEHLKSGKFESSNFIFAKKKPIKSRFSTFWVLGLLGIISFIFILYFKLRRK